MIINYSYNWISCDYFTLNHLRTQLHSNRQIWIIIVFAPWQNPFLFTFKFYAHGSIHVLRSTLKSKPECQTHLVQCAAKMIFTIIISIIHNRLIQFHHTHIAHTHFTVATSVQKPQTDPQHLCVFSQKFASLNFNALESLIIKMKVLTIRHFVVSHFRRIYLSLFLVLFIRFRKKWVHSHFARIQKKSSISISN